MSCRVSRENFTLNSQKKKTVTSVGNLKLNSMCCQQCKGLS